MRQNDSYVLRKIENVTYLLPLGQMIADQARAIQLNDTSIFLWNQLAKELTLDELIISCATYYQAQADELPQLAEDVQQFVNTLSAHGAIVSSNLQPHINLPPFKHIKIAGLVCGLYGPGDAFPNQFSPFICSDPKVIDQRIEICTGFAPYTTNGTILIRNSQLWILECETHFTLLFPTFEQLYEVHLSKDGSLATFYCNDSFTDEFKENLFHAIRLVFLYLAQRSNMVALHSASILYQNKAWLFSGPSGTGKSTHTNLWKELLHTTLINGDLNLLAFENDIPVIHGIPWCGTSEIFDTTTYPLGGIILLKQAPADYVEPLSPDKKRLLVNQRLISPSWTQELFDCNLQFVNNLEKHILICRLHCTPKSTAVDAIRKIIDEYLAN